MILMDKSGRAHLWRSSVREGGCVELTLLEAKRSTARSSKWPPCPSTVSLSSQLEQDRLWNQKNNDMDDAAATEGPVAHRAACL